MSTSFQFDKTINPGAGSDASPRSSTPDPSRVFQVPIDQNDPRRGSAIVLALDDGTSAAATFWVQDATTRTWYQVGGSVTAGPGALTDPVLLPSGADYFVRVGAVIGSPTLLRVGFVVGNSLAFSAGGAPAASTVTANQGAAGASPWPAQAEAQYNTTPATRSNAQVSTLEQDASGNLRSAEQLQPGYEDNSANRALVEQRNSYLNIAGTTAGTVVKSGPGFLHALCINKPVLNAVITIYDNTAASGTKIGTITLPATLTSDVDELIYDVAFTTGLTIVVATGATDITVSYR